MGEGSWIGLDVHARSTVAAVIDDASGEVVVARAPVGVDDLVAWVCAHRAPVWAAYEAGPTGFGLSRALEAAGVGCVVAAPSLIPRSVVGRGRKRDAQDAERLARLLRLGELVAVMHPGFPGGSVSRPAGRRHGTPVQSEVSLLTHRRRERPLRMSIGAPHRRVPRRQRGFHVSASAGRPARAPG